MEFKELLQLAKATAKANPSAPTAYSFAGKNYGYSDLNETLRTEFSKLAGTYRDYKINQNTIFALIDGIVKYERVGKNRKRVSVYEIVK